MCTIKNSSASVIVAGALSSEGRPSREIFEHYPESTSMRPITANIPIRTANKNHSALLSIILVAQ